MPCDITVFLHVVLGAVCERQSAWLPSSAPLRRSGWPAHHVSVPFFGQVSTLWPLGFACPSSRRAGAVPPPEPAFHISRMALTLSAHGATTTGSAVLSTTTVLGFASATASMSRTSSSGSDATRRSGGGRAAWPGGRRQRVLVDAVDAVVVGEDDGHRLAACGRGGVGHVAVLARV